MKDKRRFSQVTLYLHSLNFKHNIYDIWRNVSAGRGNVDRATNEPIWFPAVYKNLQKTKKPQP